MKYLFAVLLQIFLIALNAIFACAEIAVISMNETKLGIMESKGGKDAKKAKKLSKLKKDPAKFLSTIQVAITLAGFLGSAFAADMFAEPLVDAIVSTGIGVSASVISPICVILITLILAFFNIVFGELVPKRIAMKKSEGVAKGLAGILSVVSVIFKPIVFLLSKATNGVLRLFGISPDDTGEEITEEDIIMMAQVGNDSGNIGREENQLIKNVFEFNDLTVGEICTHRRNVDALYTSESIDAWMDKMYTTSHTFYPVCGSSIDDVKGVLWTKTYFRLKYKSKENIMEQAVKPPVFYLENTPANKVFDKMKKTREYFGIVLDEYGGMVGVVTIRDLIEALIGDLTESGEKEEYSITKVEENSWEIKGITPIYKVEDVLGISVDLPEDSDYQTINAYVYSLMNNLSQDNSEIETDKLKIKVLEVQSHFVTKLLLSIKD